MLTSVEQNKIFPRILFCANFNTISQYFISSKHSKKALVEDGGFTQNNSRNEYA